MHKIEIDNFIFHVNVTEYSPPIPGSYRYNADSDVDYYGYPMEIDWECKTVISGGFLDSLIETEHFEEIVDAYAEQITDKLLDIIKFEQKYAEEYY